MCAYVHYHMAKKNERGLKEPRRGGIFNLLSTDGPCIRRNIIFRASIRLNTVTGPTRRYYCTHTWRHSNKVLPVCKLRPSPPLYPIYEMGTSVK